MATSEEARQFHERSFEFLKDYPKGIPADLLVQRATSGDLDEALFAIGLLQMWLNDERQVRVFQARAAGESWNWIGARLGTSRQALWERYRDRDDAEPGTT